MLEPSVVREGIMGFESFRVELSDGNAKYDEANEAIWKLPHVEFDHHSVPMLGSTLYFSYDKKQTIEIELMDSPVRVSCRFTLSHPPSVDAVFFALVRELMHRLGMKAKICDDVRAEDARSFSLVEFADF